MRRIVCSTTAEVCTSYSSYLHSNHWKNVKEAFKASRQYTASCYTCGTPNNGEGNTHIHHRSYANLGKEQSYDLVELCGSCHTKVHAVARDKTIKMADICFAVEYLKNTIAREKLKKHKRKKTAKLLVVV